MASTIEKVSSALNYDIAESMLASKTHLDKVYITVNKLHEVREDLERQRQEENDFEEEKIPSTVKVPCFNTLIPSARPTIIEESFTIKEKF